MYKAKQSTGKHQRRDGGSLKTGGCFNNKMLSYQYRNVHGHDAIIGLVQDCGNSTADAVELPQACTKPSR